MLAFGVSGLSGGHVFIKWTTYFLCKRQVFWKKWNAHPLDRTHNYYYLGWWWTSLIGWSWKNVIQLWALPKYIYCWHPLWTRSRSYHRTFGQRLWVKSVVLCCNVSLGWAGWVFPLAFSFTLYWFCFAMKFFICAIKKFEKKNLRKERKCSAMGNTLGTWGINWEHNR